MFIALVLCLGVALAERCVVPGALTLRPPAGMYHTNRQAVAQYLMRTNNVPIDDTLLYFQGAASQARTPHITTESLFRQESNFLYMCQYQFPFSVGVISAECVVEMARVGNEVRAKSHLFVQKPSEHYAIWEGEPYTLEELRERYQVDEVYWREDMEETIAGMGKTHVLTLPNVDLDLSEARRPLRAMRRDQEQLLPGLQAGRVVKNSGELTLLRMASKVSALGGHQAAMLAGGNGGYSWEFQASTHFQAVTGACRQSRQAYLTIAPAGARTSILHYNDNLMEIVPEENDMILLDGGSEGEGGYGTDITRTWPVSGRFSKKQRAIYEAVLYAQDAAIAGLMSGASWRQIAGNSTWALLHKMKEIGLVHGSMEDLLRSGVSGTFMPHGLGHHVGIDVHDGGSREPLLEGMVLTVEPGLYFINAVIERDLKDPNKAPYLNEAVINEYRAVGNSMGGVRIEDVMEITANGWDMLSSDAPRTVRDIEEFIASGVFHYDRKAHEARCEAVLEELSAAYPEFAFPRAAVLGMLELPPQ